MSVATLNSAIPLVHTSRTVVIGLGEFGLQALSLLLPRLEVYYQFVDPTPQPQVLARLGLLSRENGSIAYHTIDRSSAAFANTREIQELILHPPPPSAGPIRPRLLQLIDLQLPEQPTSLRAWLNSLIHPAISDNLSYSESIAHLNLYIVVSASESNGDDLKALINELALIQRPPITINLIGHLGIPLMANDPAEAQSASFLSQLPLLANGGVRIQRIYLLDRSKQNLASMDSLGETALAVCNFLEQLILSRLGDELVERGLPDFATLATYTPYSSFGAAKLYVPIAEITSELLGQIVAELLQREMRNKPAGGIAGINARINKLLDLSQLCRTLLSGTPIELAPPAAWWRIRLQEFVWRLRNESQSPQVVRERLLHQVPRFRVNRRYWRERLAVYGRRRTPEVWWRALSAFEVDLLERILPEVIRNGAQQLGIRIADEHLVRALRTATIRHDPIAGELLRGNPQQRARRLADWTVQQRPELQPQTSMLRTEAEERIFTSAAIEPRDLLPSLSTWLGHHLWTDQPQSGQLGAFNREIRRDVALMLARSVAWAEPLARMLHDQRKLITVIEERLGAWTEADAFQSARDTPELMALRLQDAQARLIKAMRDQPYPAALMVRLAIIWLLPIFLVLSAVQSGIVVPSPWSEQLSTLIVGYSIAMIVLYALVIGSATLRRQRAQRRIEELIFARVSRSFERRVYAAADAVAPAPISIAPSSSSQAAALGAEPIPGLIPAYLQAFNRLFLDAPLPDPRLPSSLYAVLDGAREQLASGESEAVPQRIESLLYRSIGDKVTRELLEFSLHQHLEHRGIQLQIDASVLSERMVSPAMLNTYVRQTFKTQIGREYTTTVRATDVLLLNNLLLLPEHRRINLGQLVDDLRLRSKPMISTAQGTAQQALSLETLHYLGITPQLNDELLRPWIVREPGFYANAVRDPYGIGHVTLVHGLPAEALPIRTQHGGDHESLL